MATLLRNFIGDEWLEVVADKLEVVNPATGEALAEVPLSGKTQVDQAIE